MPRGLSNEECPPDHTERDTGVVRAWAAGATISAAATTAATAANGSQAKRANGERSTGSAMPQRLAHQTFHVPGELSANMDRGNRREGRRQTERSRRRCLGFVQWAILGSNQ
jgi:hypothetical protein